MTFRQLKQHIDRYGYGLTAFYVWPPSLIQRLIRDNECHIKPEYFLAQRLRLKVYLHRRWPPYSTPKWCSLRHKELRQMAANKPRHAH